MSRAEFSRIRYGDSPPSGMRDRLEDGGERGRHQYEISGKIERMPNTFDGHRLLHHARSYGVQHELAEPSVQ